MFEFILLMAASLTIIIGWLLVIRSDDVCDFRKSIIDLCEAYDARHIHDLWVGEIKSSITTIYDLLPSHIYMLFTFRKLTLENWLTPHELRMLMN
ncbi:MAG: hypothetical protein H7320_13730 [Ferruginibacter sp.]|nr:hypothetical protein [Ferruginibacter sp.]